MPVGSGPLRQTWCRIEPMRLLKSTSVRTISRVRRLAGSAQGINQFRRTQHRSGRRDYEAKRWDPVPGTPGHKIATVRPEDEQTLAEQLVSDGVEEADHEQMVEGSARKCATRRRTGGKAPLKRSHLLAGCIGVFRGFAMRIWLGSAVTIELPPQANLMASKPLRTPCGGGEPRNPPQLINLR